MPWRSSASRAVAAALLAVITVVVTLGYALDENRGALVRNSLVAERATGEDFNWHPSDRPVSFRGESYPAIPKFSRVLDSLAWSGSLSVPDPLPMGKAIVQHLHSVPGNEVAIRSDLRTTYRSIVDDGDGYCADFTRVFIAFAHSLGIPVRHWGMGIQNMGPGHTFVEIYSEDIGDWIFLDPYFSFYMIDRATGGPVSVLELIDMVDVDPTSIAVVPIETPGFTFPTPEDALAYYTANIDYLYMFWGDNVIELSDHSLLSFVGRFSRAGELLVAIAVGKYPRVRPLPTGSEANDAAINTLMETRRLLLTAFAAFLLFSAAALFEGYRAAGRVIQKRRGSTHRPFLRTDPDGLRP